VNFLYILRSINVNLNTACVTMKRVSPADDVT